MKTYLIGTGGVGSYLAPPLYRTLRAALPGSTLVLVDGDTVTEANLNRQLFGPSDVGRKKAKALSRTLRKDEQCGIEIVDRYLIPDHPWAENLTPGPDDIFIVAVDNHAARRAALAESDKWGCCTIIAANEDSAADAYVYLPSFAGHEILDPRLRIPAILTDTSGDPTHPEGCTGDAALTAAPQTAEANYVASALALRLFGAWAIKRKEMDREYHKYLPARLESTFTRFDTFSVEDLLNTTPKTKAA